MAYKDVLSEIQTAGKLTTQQIGNIIETLLTVQSSMFDHDDDELREAAEDAIDDAIGDE